MAHLSVPQPEALQNDDELDEWLTRPRPVLIEFISRVSSPLVILGAGGKMGPTLAVLARRAADAAGHPLQVIAVSRFSQPAQRAWLESRNVRTVACDLLEPSAVAGLPKTANAIYLAGMKFGTASNPSATWAINTLVPANVCHHFREARIVALSTGNVYPMVPVAEGGATEEHALTPLGEYANAAVARERIFDFFSRRNGTAIALLRLFYAVELRYGVLVDIARRVFRGEPVPVATNFLNCIWQGDANEMILRALPLAGSPPSRWNLCRPDLISVSETASRCGELFGKSARLAGEPSPTALLGDSSRICSRLGTPPTSVETMLGWIARWTAAGGRTLEKPTGFEVRDGRF
jgi:nucleoside-diphosphate-sugar epimerase